MDERQGFSPIDKPPRSPLYDMEIIGDNRITVKNPIAAPLALRQLFLDSFVFINAGYLERYTREGEPIEPPAWICPKNIFEINTENAKKPPDLRYFAMRTDELINSIDFKSDVNSQELIVSALYIQLISSGIMATLQLGQYDPMIVPSDLVRYNSTVNFINKCKESGLKLENLPLYKRLTDALESFKLRADAYFTLLAIGSTPPTSFLV